MKLHLLRALGISACALLLALPINAAEKSATPTHKASSSRTLRNAWSPETLTGKIISVDPAQDLVIMQDSGGIPFDLRVTKSTHIMAGDQKLTLDKLSSDLHKDVSVRFVPERSGDVARTIHITS